MTKDDNGSSGPELLDREQILKAADSGTEDVAVPEWGGTVRVKALTGDERDRYEASILQEKRDGSYRARLSGARAKLLALTVVDARGRTLFSLDDLAALGKKNAAAMQRVWKVAARLAGITEEELEELTRDLPATASDQTPSGGPSAAV